MAVPTRLFGWTGLSAPAKSVRVRRDYIYRILRVEDPKWDIAQWKGAFRADLNREGHVHCWLRVHLDVTKAQRWDRENELWIKPPENYCRREEVTFCSR